MKKEERKEEEQVSIRDPEILAVADVLRKEMSQRGREKRHSFFKGIFCGVLAGLLVSVAVVALLPEVSDQRQTITAQIGSNASENGLLTGEVKNKLNLLATKLNAYYYEDIDVEDLQNGLYKGLLEGVGDKYTAYYTEEEYKEMMESASASFSGLGIVLTQDPDSMQVTVLHVYEDSPANKAGIRAGDMIVQVENIQANSMELSELVTHMRGEKGTHVKVKIYRSGEKDYLYFDVVRDVVDVPTVTYKMLTDEIGLISITEFGAATDEQFAEAVEELEKDGMKKLIVDLRDNPGGMLESVTNILDQILPKGLLVWTEDKYGNKNEISSDADCLEIPMAVLINANSASSSEIFAGAIRDYDYGTLIGTKTFGKGIVQSIIKLDDGSAIKLTTSKYYTPKGENIHGTGIEPDIELEYEYLNPEATVYDWKEDNQMQKAVEVLEEQPKPEE